MFFFFQLLPPHLMMHPLSSSHSIPIKDAGDRVRIGQSFCHTNTLHVLLHFTHESTLQSSSFPSAWQLHPNSSFSLIPNTPFPFLLPFQLNTEQSLPALCWPTEPKGIVVNPGPDQSSMEIPFFMMNMFVWANILCCSSPFILGVHWLVAHRSCDEQCGTCTLFIHSQKRLEEQNRSKTSHLDQGYKFPPCHA